MIFSLPKCQLLQTIPVMGKPTLWKTLEDFELDQRFLLKDNSMMFLFHDQEFFNAVINSKNF